MPTSLLANSRTQIHFRCIDWDGVRTDVVLAPQTIAAYQMEHHNVYNHQINLDYLKYHQSANPPGFFVISALLAIRNVHNNLHWLMCDFRADVLLPYPSIFTQQLLRPHVVVTLFGTQLLDGGICMRLSAWVAHEGWSRGVIETCVCNALELSIAQ